MGVATLILARIFRNRINKAGRENKKLGGRVVKAAAVHRRDAPGWGHSCPALDAAERLAFTKASKIKPVAGYVLDQSQTGLTALSIDPTQVVYFGPKDLVSEVACSAFRSDDLPIIYHTGLNRILHLHSYQHC